MRVAPVTLLCSQPVVVLQKRTAANRSSPKILLLLNWPAVINVLQHLGRTLPEEL